MDIKVATKDDLQKVTNLFEQYWNEREINFTRRQLSNYIRNSTNKIFVLKEEDIIMGLINLNHTTSDLIEIRDLIVRKEFRNYGYGAKLLKFAVDYCNNNNVRKIFVLTNSNLRDAYLNYGFALEGYLKNHFVDSEDLILMSLFFKREKQVDLGKKLDDIKEIEEVERNTREGLRRISGKR